MIILVSWYNMDFKAIDSKENKKYKFFKSLFLKKNRDKNKLFLLEGKKLLIEAINENLNIENIICTEKFVKTGNFGTIIRTANAFGIKDILTINCVDKYNSKVLRATMGALFRTNIVDCNIDKIKELKGNGYRLISTTLSENSKFLEEFNFEGKNIVVMGNEANGVSEEMLNISNDHLKIDMDNSMESLNVSIATALIMYKIFKN